MAPAGQMSRYSDKDDPEGAEVAPLVEGKAAAADDKQADSGVMSISKTGLRVLALLAVQNCAKNLIMRAAVKGDADFLYSAAVIGTEGTKLLLSCIFVIATGGSPASIVRYLRLEWKKFALLAVPASIYNFQQTLEYIALRNLDAAIFSIIVQTKLLTTALFSAVLMGKKLRKAQVLSLALLTSGVMLAQLRCGNSEAVAGENRAVGIAASLGIAASSGFAAVYTERVIKARQEPDAARGANFGLAYTQIQLALTSLVIEGAWAAVTDSRNIVEKGLWHGFDAKAMISVLNSALGGLTVAAVLKFADAVLKGYATAISVMLTGVFSTVFFGTSLSTEYYLGMVNVIISVLLYNSKTLNDFAW
ncbi:nucleotide-sugar transporter-domain-containing protein [Pelagophyceae sp. CCMP2097]|nr:nucleotide-sugar transporter-domain-containing protein [Pelagophyceae sp. CCMP2097]